MSHGQGFRLCIPYARHAPLFWEFCLELTLKLDLGSVNEEVRRENCRLKSLIIEAREVPRDDTWSKSSSLQTCYRCLLRNLHPSRTQGDAGVDLPTLFFSHSEQNVCQDSEGHRAAEDKVGPDKV